MSEQRDNTGTCKVCPATYKSHKWGQIKAAAEGWVFLKNGDVFCPKHVPDWYAAWKAGQPKKESP